MLSYLSLTVMSLFVSTVALAQISTTFKSPSGLIEECGAPAILDPEASLASQAAVNQSFSGSELKTLNKVCSVDFYDNRESTESQKAAVICPKVGSSNPSLMLLELPVGITRADFIKNECPKGKRGAGELIAKFKQSISCSYTPSILAYPRFGRMLKSEIEFPFTVYRSMDLSEHLKMATDAVTSVAKAAGHDSLIAQTWRTLYISDLNPKRYGSSLYRDHFTQIYGALVPNLKNDEIYFPANGSVDGNRILNFQKTAGFARITSLARVDSLGLPKIFNKNTVQTLTLLREMGDQIVLDTLLNQADRLGNLHYRDYFVRMKQYGEYDWIYVRHVKNAQGKAEIDPTQAKEMEAKGYVLIKRMLLADNDCGIVKENVFKGAGIAQKIAHLHPDTYRAIQQLNQLANRGILSSYLKDDLLFTDRDVVSVQVNIKSLAEMFKKKCLAGTLHLDADLAQYLGAKSVVPNKSGCEI